MQEDCQIYLLVQHRQCAGPEEVRHTHLTDSDLLKASVLLIEVLLCSGVMQNLGRVAKII